MSQPASVEKPRVIVGIPMERLPMASPEVFFSFMGLAQQGWPLIKTDYARTDIQRNKFAVHALKQGYEYLLMLDSDHVHPPNIVFQLLHDIEEHPEYEIIGGLAFRRGEPFEPMAYHLTRDGLLASLVPREAKIYEVDRLATCSMLIRCDVFKRLPYPWFQYNYDNLTALGWPNCDLSALDDNLFRSEDIFFCKLAKDHGLRIYVDARVKSPHITTSLITESTFLAHTQSQPIYHQMALANRAVPELFQEGPAKRVLYVGARPSGFTLGPQIYEAGHDITLLEVWPENAEHFRQDKRVSRVIEGDVRTMDTLDVGHFDIAVWWHGPEHVQREELPVALANLERVADTVLVGCPWGEYPQGELYGNPHERHVQTVREEDLRALGYEVNLSGKQNTPTGNMAAWKRVRQAT